MGWLPNRIGGPVALSSVYGKIDRMLIGFPGEQGQIKADMVVRRYEAMFKAFGDRVTFVVMGNFGAHLDAIRKQLEERNHHPELIDTPIARPSHTGRDVYKHGGFVEDAFVVMESRHGETMLLEQYMDVRGKNTFLADQYADAMRVPILPTRFAVEGGNILIGNDFALVGRNLLQRNRHHYEAHLDPMEVERRMQADFQRLLGMRYVYFIGSDHPLPDAKRWYPEHPEALQPFFHLDLYLSLGGKDKVGDEIIMLAEIDLPSVGKDLSDPQRKTLEGINVALKAVKDQLSEISRHSFGPKFRIEEIPMSGCFVGDETKGQRFVPYSYNNAQFEWYHGISRVYLPHYAGCEHLEQRLRENLPGLGFARITFVEYDFEDFALQNGSLHCLTKVLQRSNY